MLIPCLSNTGKVLTRCPDCRRLLTRESVVVSVWDGNVIDIKPVTVSQGYVEIHGCFEHFRMFCEKCDASLFWRPYTMPHPKPDVSLTVENKSAFVGVIEKAIKLKANKRQSRFHLFLSREGRLNITEHKDYVRKSAGSYIGVFWFTKGNNTIVFKGALFYNMERDIEKITFSRGFISQFLYSD